MNVFIVTEALYLRGENLSPSECLYSYAEAYGTKEAALTALHELVDMRIYEANEGLDNRDIVTDEEVAKVFDRPDEKRNWAMGVKWENSDYAYKWCINESDVSTSTPL